jgi:diguanylate cyclase (GGDEF)-like protein
LSVKMPAMSGNKPILVLLAIRDRAAAGAARAVLEASPSWAFSTRQVHSLVDLPGLLDEAPHALVLDLDQDDLRGLDSLRAAHELAPTLPIIAVVDPAESTQGLDALRHGAQDFLVRGVPMGHALERAILHSMARMEAIRPLHQRSLRDEATGLPNRALFLDRLGMAMRRAMHTQTACSVAILQLHGVDEIEGRYGNLPADMLIRSASKRLRERMGPTDTVGRFQRDEFGLILESVNEAGQGQARVSGVVAELERPFRLVTPRDGIVQATLKVHRGVASFPDQAQTAGRLLALADRALFSSVTGASA